MADNKIDLLLFDAIKRDDEKAFKVLFLKYYAHLCRYASKFLNNDPVVEELVSDLLLHVWNGRKELNIRHDMKSYLLLAVKNRVLNYKRSRIFLHSAFQEELTELDHATTESPLEQLINHELMAEIDRKIAQLPEKRQLMFRLHKVEGLAYSEIADKMNVTEKTVKNQVFRAVKILKDTTLCFFLLFLF